VADDSAGARGEAVASEASGVPEAAEAQRPGAEDGSVADVHAGMPLPPAVLEPADGQSVSSSVPQWVRNWLIALTVVVALQVLLTCGSVTFASLAASFVPFGMDDAYMDTEDVSQQLTYLVQDRDIDGYLELYRDDDATVDRDRVRAEFEKVLASVDASASIDYSADQVVRFTDKETDERILRMDLAAYNWNTGNQLGRGITVWVLEEELPEVVLTGRKGRELDGGEYVW